jgi:hypothetical protein
MIIHNKFNIYGLNRLLRKLFLHLNNIISTAQVRQEESKNEEAVSSFKQHHINCTG